MLETEANIDHHKRIPDALGNGRRGDRGHKERREDHTRKLRFEKQEAISQMKRDEKGTPGRANSMSKAAEVRKKAKCVGVIIGSSKGSCAGMGGRGGVWCHPAGNEGTGGF